MRVVVDEDIPSSLTPLFRATGHEVSHVEELGLKGTRNSVLLATIAASADVLVTGDSNLGHQQNLANFDLAIILVRPPRLVIDRIIPLIPAVLAAIPTARKHAVTTIGRPKTARTRPAAQPKASPKKPKRKPR